jgi:PAS domain S-box-containing protein
VFGENDPGASAGDTNAMNSRAPRDDDSATLQTILVRGDEALASAVRDALADRSRTIDVVVTGDSSSPSRSRPDCVVSRSRPQCGGSAITEAAVGSAAGDGGTEDASTDRLTPVVLYPERPADDLARQAADDAPVRYVPESIDTDDHGLLADAIDASLSATPADSDRDRDAAGRDLLEATAELADVGGWAFDARTETLTWTAETYRLHGIDRSFEPTLEQAIECYHPADRAAVRTDIEAALEGERFDSTYRLVRADGEIRQVRSRGRPVVAAGEVVGVRGAFQDVTDRKRPEAAARRFKRAVEAAGHAIFITDRTGTIEYVNPAFEDVTGYAPEEVIGEDPSLLKSGEMDQAYYADLWSTILSGEVWSEPILNERKSGDHYHASETIAPITDDDGTVEGFVAIQTDITEQVHTRERLETFREIANRLEDPIMLQDCDGNFEVVNDAVVEYAGLPRSDLIGDDEFAFMDPTTARAVDDRKREVLESERSIDYEITPTFPTKGQRSFVTTRYPLYDEDDEIDGMVAICRDITDRAEREHQLRVLDRILRHNLYNKMNLILGHAELLEDRTSGEARHSAQQIRSAGADLVELADKERRIVDLLTDETECQDLSLQSVVEDVVADLEAEYPDREVAVECSEPFVVSAIPEIRDAIAELVENAFIHAGDDVDVTVRVGREDDRVVVTVSDTGSGIPEMEQRAAQGPGDITPLFHGSGLGLQFVYHVAKRSNGSVRFESPGGVDAAAGDDGDTVDAADDAAAATGGVVSLSLPTADSGDDPA